MSILKFLGLDRAGDAGGRGDDASATTTVRKIVDALDRMDPDRARFIACFANILSRVANADMEISPEEVRAMERIVRDLGGLREEEAILVVQMAKSHAVLFGSTESHLATREFNRLAGPDEKLHLVECLFAVSSADESISAAEDAEIRRITQELLLTHGDFIRARSAYARYLDVLKGEEGRGRT